MPTCGFEPLIRRRYKSHTIPLLWTQTVMHYYQGAVTCNQASERRLAAAIGVG